MQFLVAIWKSRDSRCPGIHASERASFAALAGSASALEPLSRLRRVAVAFGFYARESQIQHFRHSFSLALFLAIT